MLLGEDLNFDVDAVYYSGGFVAGAEIDWTLTADEFNFYAILLTSATALATAIIIITIHNRRRNHSEQRSG